MAGDRDYIRDQQAVYFTTSTVVYWVDLFSRKEYRNILVDSLNYSVRHKGLVINGWVIKMFFDDHNPPHFHVEYQEFDAIVQINDGVVKGEMPNRALKMVFEWMELHREELLLNWNSIQSTGDYTKIEPLK